MDQQEDRLVELMERLEWKQRELTRLKEVEEEPPTKTQSIQEPAPHPKSEPEYTGQIEERGTSDRSSGKDRDDRR